MCNVRNIQGGAGNVIPLILYKTHFLLQKPSTSVTELILKCWKIVNKESLQIVSFQVSHFVLKCARKRL